MKKVILLGVVAVFALASCKKEYTCCTKIKGSAGEGTCVTDKFTKEEIETIEQEEDFFGVTYTTECN